MSQIELEDLEGRAVWNLKNGQIAPLLERHGFELQRSRTLHGPMWKHKEFSDITVGYPLHQTDQGFAHPGTVRDIVKACQKALHYEQMKQEGAGAQTITPIVLPEAMHEQFGAVKQGKINLLFYKDYPGLRVSFPEGMKPEKALHIFTERHGPTLKVLESLRDDYDVDVVQGPLMVGFHQSRPKLDAKIWRTNENFPAELAQVAERAMNGMKERASRLRNLAKRDGFDIALAPDQAGNVTKVSLTHLARPDILVEFPVKGLHQQLETVELVSNVGEQVITQMENYRLTALKGDAKDRALRDRERITRNMLKARARMVRNGADAPATNGSLNGHEQENALVVSAPDIIVAGITVKPQSVLSRAEAQPGSDLPQR